MPRTLTANATPPQKTPATLSKTASQSADQTIAYLFGCIGDLWRYGNEWAVWHDAAERQNQQTHALWQQLQDPALKEHPRYSAALERYWTWERRYRKWQAYAESIERVAQGVQRNLAKHLKKLSQKRRDELLANQGWVRDDDPEKVAAGMWARAKRLEVWPEGEAGFLSSEDGLSAERVDLSLAWLWTREEMTWPNTVPPPF